MGAPLAGVHLGIPTGDLSGLYANSTGISLWRNFWAKLRFGPIELMGGYQRFKRTAGQGGSLFVFPLTANVVVRAPDALFRPYASIGGGAYGWDARTATAPGVRQIVTGWDLGWTGAAGVEYYLRPRVAFDVSLRYHSTSGPGPLIGLPDKRLRFWGVWIGHYVRF
jgi:opacity protein-like surface antigen